MLRVVVAFALDERVEELRAHVRKYLRGQGATERPLQPGDWGAGTTTYGGFECGLAAVEVARNLRRGVEAIVGPSGLTRFVISVQPDQKATPIARIHLRRAQAFERRAECG